MIDDNIDDVNDVDGLKSNSWPFFTDIIPRTTYYNNHISVYITNQNIHNITTSTRQSSVHISNIVFGKWYTIKYCCEFQGQFQ